MRDPPTADGGWVRAARTKGGTCMSGAHLTMRRATAIAALVLAAGPLAAQEEHDPRFEPRFTYAARRGILRDKGLVTIFYRVSSPERGTELAAYLTKWKSAQGDITHTPKLNLLTITETDANIGLLTRILEIVDAPEPQVMIEAKVVEVTYDSQFQWGGEASWFDPTERDNTFLRRVTETFNPDAFLNAVATGQPYQGTTLDFRVLGHEEQSFSQVRATLRALVERGNAEILSSPRLLVQNGEQAEINTGSELPILDVTTNLAANYVTTRYKKVGITLKVKPYLIGNDAVDMTVDAEVSNVSGFTEASAFVPSNPIISTRSVKTRVNVRDNETLVIGGLLRDESLVQERGIPLLADLPIVGFLFKSYRRSQSKQELIFFLTPTIQRSGRTPLPPGERR